MALVPLLPIFHRLNGNYFNGLLTKENKPIVSVRWSDGRLSSTAGFYRRRNRVAQEKLSEIVLSKPILSRLPLSAIESTLCHEMIHAWVDLILKVKEVHGINFKKRMVEINSLQKDFRVTVRHDFPVPLKSPKWLGICPSCRAQFKYRRLVRGAACRSCCNIYYGGRWDERCLLNYEPILKEA